MTLRLKHVGTVQPYCSEAKLVTSMTLEVNVNDSVRVRYSLRATVSDGKRYGTMNSSS